MEIPELIKLLPTLVTVHCPICSEDMRVRGGGGRNGEVVGVGFQCKNDHVVGMVFAKAFITMPSEHSD